MVRASILQYTAYTQHPVILVPYTDNIVSHVYCSNNDSQKINV